VTDLSNYNAAVFTGKRSARTTSIHSKHEKGITEPIRTYTESPTKNIGNLPEQTRDLH